MATTRKGVERFEVYDPSGEFVSQHKTWEAATRVARKHGVGSNIDVVVHDADCPYLRDENPSSPPPCVHDGEYEIWELGEDGQFEQVWSSSC